MEINNLSDKFKQLSLKYNGNSYYNFFMSHIALYIAGIALIWWIYRVGWTESIKTILSVLIPSLLIIVFNIKAGRLLFRNPILGFTSILPTSLLIYRGSKPLVLGINSWFDKNIKESFNLNEVVDAELISKEDA